MELASQMFNYKILSMFRFIKVHQCQRSKDALVSNEKTAFKLILNGTTSKYIQQKVFPKRAN